MNKDINNTEYFGLFLREEDRRMLLKKIPPLRDDFKLFLDHLTLIHRSAFNEQNLSICEDLLKRCGEKIPVTIVGTGLSDRAFAFACELPQSLFCANKQPHITICTMNGGKPVESNYITKWDKLPFPPITVQCELRRVIHYCGNGKLKYK